MLASSVVETANVGDTAGNVTFVTVPEYAELTVIAATDVAVQHVYTLHQTVVIFAGVGIFIGAFVEISVHSCVLERGIRIY